jgi:hypothetical protein
MLVSVTDLNLTSFRVSREGSMNSISRARLEMKERSNDEKGKVMFWLRFIQC